MTAPPENGTARDAPQTERRANTRRRAPIKGQPRESRRAANEPDRDYNKSPGERAAGLLATCAAVVASWLAGARLPRETGQQLCVACCDARNARNARDARDAWDAAAVAAQVKFERTALLLHYAIGSSLI